MCCTATPSGRHLPTPPPTPCRAPFMTLAGQTPISSMSASSSPIGLQGHGTEPTRNTPGNPPPSLHFSSHLAPPNAYDADTTSTGDHVNPSALRTALSEELLSSKGFLKPQALFLPFQPARPPSRTSTSPADACATPSTQSIKWKMPSNVNGPLPSGYSTRSPLMSRHHQRALFHRDGQDVVVDPRAGSVGLRSPTWEKRPKIVAFVHHGCPTDSKW